MMRVCAFLSCLALLPAGVFAQTGETTAKFLVADVHNSPHDSQPFLRGPFWSNGRYELRYATMVDLIRLAYNVDPEKVTGGPNWLEMDRFDVFAKLPAGSTAESRRQMLQALLADRFKLAMHNDQRPMMAYALTAGKHPQMKEADASGDTGCNFAVQNAPKGPPAPGTPLELPVINYTCKNMTMTAFANGMLAMAGAGQYFNNTLVVDRTELKGSWDFNFRFTPKIPSGIPTTGENIPLFDALEKQLGLKAEISTVPMPVIVVDTVNQKPTENSAEAMKSFPPLPTEFEVASLKPTAPDASAGKGGGPPRPDIKNGRVYLPGISLKNLISIAWNVNGDEMMVGVPKWAEDDRYDIVAKAPSDVAIGDLTPMRGGISVNIDALRPMIQSLIKDRFQMVAHVEQRPLNAYNLVAAKPKLKKADPASRTKWQEGAQPESKGSKNANTALGRLVTCQNVTMAQFAQMLPGIAPGYLHTDVVDATGLEGGWDFTFSFSPIGALQMVQAATGENNEAPEPNGAISLFDAMTKQLGLKLELQKRPAPVLVVEKIERKPLEN
jgi:uncharacterized protein (TIGR03435 family)